MITNYHKLLQKQLKKYLTDDEINNPSIHQFLSSISDSYTSFERDKELLNHAFGISETEYQKLYEDLNSEYELKRVSIEKLKDAVKELDQKNEVEFNSIKDELLVIVDYLKNQIIKRKETEHDLSRTLQLLTTLLSNLNSGILVEDEHRKILFTNKLFCDTFSIDAQPEQLIGTDCSNSAEQTKHLFKNPESFVNRINEILQKKSAILGDILELEDGRILERDYIPIYIENEYKGHFWDYTDITEQKYFENKLIDLTNIQNAILNGTDYAIIYTNTKGIIKSFNKGAELMLGYKAHEVVDLKTPGIFHDVSEIEKRAQVLSLEFNQKIKIGFDTFVKKAQTNQVDTNEWTYITKNGERLTVLLSVSKIQDSHNEIIGYLGVARNITEQKIVQQELELSEKRYRNIVEKSSDLIYKINEKGCFTYVNAATEKISGYKADELLGTHYSVLIQEKFKRAIQLQYYQQMKQQNKTSYFEFPIATKAGNIKWIGQNLQIMRRKDFIEFTAIGIDVTEKKDFELALLDTNKNLELVKTLINNTSDAIQVAKENGQLVYINHEAAERIGIDPERATEYFVKNFEKIFTNDKEWYRHVNAVKKRGPLIIEGENFNIKTQQLIPVEVTVRFVEIDNVGYIIANSRNIAERKRIEEIARKEKEKYQSIIANMNLGLMEVDLNERIQFVNHGFEKISGYTKEELVNQKAAELFTSEAHVKLIEDKVVQRKQGLSDMYEVPVKNKTGELRWWMISGAPNYDNQGNLIGTIGIHLDITEQKQLELELELAKSKAEESSKAKEAFLANMSHEIRTPLNAIIGMIRELSKDDLSSKQKQYANNASVASQHLLSVLNNVLDISKIEAGELQLENHHFNFSEVLSDVKSIMQAKASEKGLYVKINHPSTDCAIFIGDSARFRQIFLNLIGNAIKFTQDGGVTISYQTEKMYQGFESLHIEISDTGIGMDETYLKNIFNKFSQEDASTSRKYGGSGLGMAITYELIQLMNGSVKVKSQKNRGTTIEMNFLLPIGDKQKIEDTKALPAKNKLENLTILLVEDNEFNRAVACNTLNYYNCKITESHDGSQAVELLKTGKSFDIILMDLQMPIMDGFEATKIIRTELKIDTPIIALTANAFKSELEQCLKTGMNDCVTKPFEEDVLLNTIAKWTNVEGMATNKIEKELALQNEKLYNLEKLISISRNDTAYVQKMVQIFSDQSLLAITQIGDAYKVKDLDTVYKVSHRIKPSIDSMGITILYDDIRKIEKDSKDGIDSPELEKNILFLFSVLHQVVNQLNQEF